MKGRIEVKLDSMMKEPIPTIEKEEYILSFNF